MIRPDQIVLTGDLNTSYLDDKSEKPANAINAARGNEQEEKVKEQFVRIVSKDSQSEEEFEMIDPEMCKEIKVEEKPSNLFSTVSWLFSGFKKNEVSESIERARERCLTLGIELQLQSLTIDSLEQKLKAVEKTLENLQRDNKHLKDENSSLKDNQEVLQNQVYTLMQENNRLKDSLERK